MELILCQLVSVSLDLFIFATDGTSSFVDRDMYMRFRGGGVGHVPTRIEDPEEAAGPGEDMDLDSETAIPIPEPAEDDDEDDFWDENGNERGSDESEDGEDEGNQEDDDEDETRNGEDEQDDLEGLGAEQIQKRLREVIIEDLGYSEM